MLKSTKTLNSSKLRKSEIDWKNKEPAKENARYLSNNKGEPMQTKKNSQEKEDTY
jgi:hypothetical protein